MSPTPPGSRADEFDFELPPGCIAQAPARPRDSARLLVPHLPSPDRIVADLPGLLRPHDLLVVNDTRVIPAQLAATRRRPDGSAARIGVTLDQRQPDGRWRTLVRNARRLAEGDVLELDGSPMRAVVAGLEPGGVAHLRFDRDGAGFDLELARAGRLALPPYIRRSEGPTVADATDYQTAFARASGAVAAPTAGLHFTPALIARLGAAGIAVETVTLHVGAGTFLPMREADVAAHRIHAEHGIVSPRAADAIRRTRERGHRIVAVGTTTLRILETAAAATGEIRAFDGQTTLFLRPGARITTADLLLTNFHLPRSTLFMLVCAFAGTGRMRAAYAHAIETGYRFYSYGDACLLERAG